MEDFNIPYIKFNSNIFFELLKMLNINSYLDIDNSYNLLISLKSIYDK